MKNSFGRQATAAIITACLLFVAACTPAPPDAPGTQTIDPATNAQISRHFSGNSASTTSGGAYYAGNGSYKSYYYLSEVPNVCTGSWRASGSKLVVKESCDSVSKGKTISSGPDTSSYAVYIRSDGSARLDEKQDDHEADKWDISKPVNGFAGEAEFASMQEKIESGQPVELAKDNELSTAELVIGIPLWLAMCIGTAGFLCI